jgi:hypothetical protein
MSRYYFHTEDGRRYPDETGAELNGMDEVRRWSIRALSEMLEAQADAFWDDGSLRMVVQDDRGLTLFTIEAALLRAPAAGGPAKF